MICKENGVLLGNALFGAATYSNLCQNSGFNMQFDLRVANDDDDDDDNTWTIFCNYKIITTIYTQDVSRL